MKGTGQPYPLCTIVKIKNNNNNNSNNDDDDDDNNDNNNNVNNYINLNNYG